MTLAVVKYLLQQGYRPDQLVVLTPYLGQLLELHKALRGSNQQVGAGIGGMGGTGWGGCTRHCEAPTSRWVQA